MQDERSTMQKMEDFSQAFSEFLRRPKTIFDMKDRFRLLRMVDCFSGNCKDLKLR